MINKVKDLLKDQDFMHRYASVIFAGLFLLAFNILAIAMNSTFLSLRNVNRLIEAAFPLMMVAFGQTICLLIGGIDISLGSIVSLTNVVCITFINVDSEFGWIPGILAAIVCGFLCGALNGFITQQFHIPALIVTISMSIVYADLALFIMPVPGGMMHMGFYKFIKFKFFDVIPNSIILIFIILVIVRTITNRTAFGKAVRAMGGNVQSAYSAGINIKKTEILAFGLSGLLCGLGGIYMAVYINSGDPTIGTGMQMNAISASVIGGVSMVGANGDLIGTMFGVFIFTLISNLLNLNGISTNYQFLIKGFILIVALAISSIRNREE